ncbi:MAG: HAD family phosphatase [Chitinophagaceae bacterium]|jgi:FMN phosphatase YigB (HAD superfamily)|nr:HAD family phosphatase [Chitinophagaceae bacterium]
MIKGIKHIIFDLGNVLLNINPNLTYEALKKLGIPNFETAYKELVENNLFNRLETNEVSAADFIQTISDLCPQPIATQAIIDAWNALLLDFPLRRLQILQQLQLHYDLILLSNTNEIHEQCFNQKLQLAHGIPNIGVFFDKVYFSHRIGMRKPNQAIYERVIDDCGFCPEHTLFIDDLEDNVLAAAELNIQTIWLKEGMTIEKDIFLPFENNFKA